MELILPLTQCTEPQSDSDQLWKLKTQTPSNQNQSKLKYKKDIQHIVCLKLVQPG